MTDGTPADTRHGTQSIDRAAQLLAEVVNASEPVPFRRLCTATELPKSTISRLMLALERHQLVRRDTAGRFIPGSMLTRVADAKLSALRELAEGWRGLSDPDAPGNLPQVLSVYARCAGDMAEILGKETAVAASPGPGLPGP